MKQKHFFVLQNCLLLHKISNDGIDMSRIIGIDYGRKRTGIAVTDPLQMIAGGLETVASGDVEKWLERYMAVEAVERIVVGCPTMPDGSESDTMTRYVQPFINRLKNKFPNIAIDTLDERYTSKLAVRAMIDGGMKKKDRRNKANVDKISATILLQGYVASRQKQIEETSFASLCLCERDNIAQRRKGAKTINRHL